MANCYLCPRSKLTSHALFGHNQPKQIHKCSRWFASWLKLLNVRWAEFDSEYVNSNALPLTHFRIALLNGRGKVELLKKGFVLGETNVEQMLSTQGQTGVKPGPLAVLNQEHIFNCERVYIHRNARLSLPIPAQHAA